MAYTLPLKYFAPRRSKTEQVLDKHHYERKVYRDENGKLTYFLAPVHDNLYDAIANLNEGVRGPEHFSGAIVYREGESTKELFIRLGWITESGEIV